MPNPFVWFRTWREARFRTQLRATYAPRLDALERLTARAEQRKAEVVQMQPYREARRRVNAA